MLILLSWILRLAPESWVRAFLPYDAKAIKLSFAPVRPRIAEYSPRFYENFWADYPETRALFGRNMSKAELDARINHFMLFMTENADKPWLFIDYMRGLSRRHKGYGIFGHHFAFVCETHLKTMRQILNRELESGEELAWRNGFGFLTKIMKGESRFKELSQAAPLHGPR